MSFADYQSISGIGLRPQYYPSLLEGRGSELEFLEIVSENFTHSRGRPFQVLKKLRQNFPIAMHGVSLNIGSTDAVRIDYLRKLKSLMKEIEPILVSDHLCWTGAHQKNWYDLFPLPMTEETVKNCVEKIKQVQDFLGRQICLENISTYLRFQGDEMTEHEFMCEVSTRADCFLLFDVNNLYVNSVNHHFNAYEFIRQMPIDRIKQYHLAGHTKMKNFLFDTHDEDICEDVWDLYHYSIKTIGPRPTLIERDDNFPSLEKLVEEAELSKAIMLKAFNQRRRRNA